MLWFDNDPKTALTTKIEKAAGYYRQKYGRNPNLCLVHPSMLGGNNTLNNKEMLRCAQHDNCKIDVRPYRPILPGHLWIGIDESRFKEDPK